MASSTPFQSPHSAPSFSSSVAVSVPFCLLISSTSILIMLSPQSIISSPYDHHRLDLSSLKFNHILMSQALQNLHPVENYLDVEYIHAFNWSEILLELPFTDSFYIVVFRSTLAKNDHTTKLALALADEKAHQEGQESGGLLKYWFGTAQLDGRNLATCVWTHERAATLASTLGSHQRAVELVQSGVYSKWKIERYALHIMNGGYRFVALNSPHSNL